MKNSKLLLLLMLLCCQNVFAQNDRAITKLELETRIDYQRVYIGNQEINDDCGFKGKYLNFRFDGNLTDNLSFSYRQRLNKAHSNQSFFDATDWLYLNYNINKKWSIAFGKQVVAIGGYDYDRAPIDSYTYSEYLNNIPCFQMGGSVSYAFNEYNKLTLQICESPFRKADEDMYAYNLFWSGRFLEGFETLYSVNMLEYLPGKFINYIALGNKYRSNTGELIELDIMNRNVVGHSFSLDNYSINARVTFELTEYLNLLFNGSHDVNKTEVAGDYCVLPGTDITRTGVGFECYPMGNKSLRLHLFYFRMLGENSNVAGTLVDNQNIFSFGVKWNLDLLSFKRK
ncbi:MAG: hypothetical protein J6Q35_01120 [Rikenellaceae bacterium]|nr:hypothetical protein [Rikenellaceae bacterium]